MLRRLLFLVGFCCGSSLAMSQAQDQLANLKAAFIYNFTHYIEWDVASDNDFVIGIIGPSIISAPLNEMAKTKNVNNKKIIIRHFNKPEEIDGCQILFIPQNLPYSLSSILDNTGKGTLTISEEPGYAKLGTAFNFVVLKDKLKFEANLNSIKMSGLKAGSQLLKLAIIIDD